MPTSIVFKDKKIEQRVRELAKSGKYGSIRHAIEQLIKKGLESEDTH